MPTVADAATEGGRSDLHQAMALWSGICYQTASDRLCRMYNMMSRGVRV